MHELEIKLLSLQKLDTSEMLDHIHNVRQAIRYAVSDLKGQELPGFSIPKKVRKCFKGELIRQCSRKEGG